MEFKGLRSFAAFLDEGSVRCAESQAAAAKITAERMAVVARSMYGQNPPLAELRPATQDERISKGYSADEPLLRDGHLLRDSVKPYSTNTLAVIESNEPIAFYHEFGYTTRPFGNPLADLVAVEPRPVFRYTIEAMGPAVIEMGGQIAKKTLGIQ